MILGPGDRAPGFRVPDQFGSVIDLTDLTRHSSIVLVFYPFAFSPVCGDEISALEEIQNDLRKSQQRVDIIGMSTDSKYTLAAWAESNITFGLGSDFWPHGAVASSYGVFDAGQGVAERGVFVISGQGTIVKSRQAKRSEVRDFRSDIAQAIEVAQEG